MYDIEFTDIAKRQFLKLEKKIQERIGSVLERVRIRPQHFVEKLVGESGFKLRIGDYRVFLDIYQDKMVILVLQMGARKNIYKK